VDDLVKTYGSNTDGLIKMQAQDGAAKARNEALNLSCPHCKVVCEYCTVCTADL
jgi:hypothetical protein